MLWVSVVAFALAALGGLTLLVLRLRQKVLPMPLALLHGMAAVVGLVCLIVAVTATAASPLATYALIGFTIGGLGGFYLFSIHLRGKIHPVLLILGHGGTAVASFVLLVLAALAT
jgi:hypothetical protein